MNLIPHTLEGRLAAAVTGLLTAVGLFMGVFFLDELGRSARTALEERARMTQAILSNAVMAGVEFDSPASVEESLKVLDSLPDVKCAAVYRDSGELMSALHREAAPAQMFLPEDSPQTLTMSDAGLTLAGRLQGKGGARGILLLAMSTDELQAQLARHRRVVLLAVLAIILLGLAASIFLGRLVSRPIRIITGLATAVASRKDLSITLAVGGSAEARALGNAFQEMVSHLRAVLSESRSLADELHGMMASASTVQLQFEGGASDITIRVAETTEQALRLSESMREMSGVVGAASQAASGGAKVIRDVDTHNQRVTVALTSVVTSVEECVDTLGEIVAHTREVEANARGLSFSMRDAAAATRQVCGSMERVSADASGLARLASEVDARAHDGESALDQTQAIIESAKNAMMAASEAMTTLGQRVAGVDAALVIIEDIAARTNLLALNASIIASQSGEAGRAFGVVAEEVRTLSARTRQSTMEISELISQVHRSADATSAAMASGTQTVLEGVAQGKLARQALEAIVEAAQQSSRGSHAIAEATAAQNSRTAAVTAQVEHAAESAGSIHTGSATYRAAAEGAARRMEATRALTNDAATTIAVQREAAAQIAQVLASIIASMPTLRNIHELGRSRVSDVQGAANAISAVAEQQAPAAQALSSVVSGVRERVGKLKTLMDQFRV